MDKVYHTPQQGRTRPADWLPRRAYYVLRFLKKTLTPGKPTAISNAQIKAGLRFGSEGEVSQLMRYLAGELPTSGRWAYSALNTTPQERRHIVRERMPSGGYLITLLRASEPIEVAVAAAPEATQLTLWGQMDDPPMIPQEAQQHAADGGSCVDDPPRRPARRHRDAANGCSAGDHHKKTLESKQQQQPPLVRELIAEGVDPGEARQIAKAVPDRTIAQFREQVDLAQSLGKRSPIGLIVHLWKQGGRLAAQEQSHEQRTRGSRAARPAAASNPAPSFAGAPVRYELIY
jgi:hypothetical protein